jgi:hypothetical protein
LGNGISDGVGAVEFVVCPVIGGGGERDEWGQHHSARLTFKGPDRKVVVVDGCGVVVLVGGREANVSDDEWNCNAVKHAQVGWWTLDRHVPPLKYKNF